LEAAATGARLAQYLGAALVFGWPLFQLYTPAARPISRSLLGAAAAFGASGAFAALVLQAAAMTGAPVAFDPALWGEVLVATTFGHGLAARLLLLGAAGAALVLLAPGKRLWIALALIGAGVCASFAWTGHAAGGDGVLGTAHQAADIVHMLAAAMWLGALPALALLAFRPTEGGGEAHAALARFSGLGGWMAAALLASGLVNSAVLVGPAQALRLTETPYGRLLAAKLALFVLMLALAAANRFVLAPALGRALAQGRPHSLSALRASLVAETLLGAAVLALVAALGLQPPPGRG
jgi:putative copper resistance protein D